MGRDALLEQAAATAEAAANQARSAQTSDDQIFFNTAQGRREMGEETRGVDLLANARGAFPDDGESAAPSDLEPLRARDPLDIPPTSSGLPLTQEDPRFLGQVRAFDDFSDVGAPTEAGFVDEERPPQGLTDTPPRPDFYAAVMEIQPDFIPETLEVDGKSVYKPDLGTEDMPYRSWEIGPPGNFFSKKMSYFFSAPGNFLDLHTGPKSLCGGVAPLSPPPALPGVIPSGHPLQATSGRLKVACPGG